jgi:hypothetical protein
MTLFDTSYVFFWIVALTTGLLLKLTLRQAVGLLRMRSRLGDSASAHQLPTITEAPAFAATLRGSSHVLTAKDFIGIRTALLFVSPSDAGSTAYRYLDMIVHWLWHRTEGQLYVVCTGAAEPCERFFPSGHVGWHALAMVNDFDGSLSRAFTVKETPLAIA